MTLTILIHFIFETYYQLHKSNDNLIMSSVLRIIHIYNHICAVT